MHIFLQITDPPQDFHAFLLWFIGILVTVVGTMFYLLKAAMDARIDDRDETIKDLREDVKNLEASREKLMMEVKQGFETSNSVFASVLEMMRKT